MKQAAQVYTEKRCHKRSQHQDFSFWSHASGKTIIALTILVASKMPHSHVWTKEMEMPRMSFRAWNSTLTEFVGRRPEKCWMLKMKLESFKINIWARDWKILNISLQINKFQYQNIRSRAQEIPKNELQESQNMFGSSRGPRQAKNKHWEIQNQHF